MDLMNLKVLKESHGNVKVMERSSLQEFSLRRLGKVTFGEQLDVVLIRAVIYHRLQAP